VDLPRLPWENLFNVSREPRPLGQPAGRLHQPSWRRPILDRPPPPCDWSGPITVPCRSTVLAPPAVQEGNEGIVCEPRRGEIVSLRFKEVSTLAQLPALVGV
jgi:hypothetical protein